MKKRFTSGLIAAAFWSGQAVAQTLMPITNDDLSKETENPVTRQTTLPLRYQADFLDGADKLTKDTLELDQAILPFRLNDDWSLITRTKLPAEALPPKKAGDSWTDGLSNGYTTFFLSPEHGREFYWGAGPMLYYPATSATLGATKWGSGPSVAFIHEDAGPWVFALVANNIWTFPCLLVAVQILGPNSAQSQSYPLPYVRLLTSEEVREVLNCPWCNDALLVAAGTTLLVRTTEGVNLTFANLVIARGAVELLNSMARAKNRCARAEYDLALGQYRDLIGLRDEKTAQGGSDEASVFELLNPHHDLSPLAEYVVPLFQDCGPYHIAASDKAERSRGRWSKR